MIGRGVVVCALALVALAPGVETRQSGYEFRGVVVTPSGPQAGGVVTTAGDVIKSVGTTATAGVIDVGGVIVPGLIDLHNHLTWNVIPRWSPGTTFGSRYEWQEHPDYALNLSGPHYTLTTGGHACDMHRYAEIRALIHGTTSAVGGMSNPTENSCITGLVRNLDFDSDLPGTKANAERLRNVVFPFESDSAAEDVIRNVNPTAPDASPLARAVVMHVGEGVDAGSRREFRQLRAHGFLKAGVSVTHAINFTAAQFLEMKTAGVGFIWSPRSNLELYGRTADVITAKKEGVTMAIAPDWSPTGGVGMLDELATAWKLNVGLLANTFSDSEMFRMATSNPAALAALSGKVGSIAAGAMADLLVLEPKDRTYYQPLVRSNAGDVRLVMIGGVPLFGDATLMGALLPTATLEPVTVCGKMKAVNVSGGAATQTLAAVSSRLSAALASAGSALAPLAECR